MIFILILLIIGAIIAYGYYYKTQPDISDNEVIIPDIITKPDIITPIIPYTPVDCKVSNWSNWSECDKDCGTGNQTRTRIVTEEASYGGIFCPNLEENQSCNTQECPIDCSVSNWSDWSKCDKDCGTGNQTRTRTITEEAQNEGQVCSILEESQTCNTQECPIDCLGEWSSYGICSKTCGGGTQTRMFKVNRAAAYGGKDCSANDNQTQSQTCNTQGCPVDCVGNWEPWSACTKTCGGGTQTRKYKITTASQNGGAVCPIIDNTIQSQSCNTQNCPVDCVGDWGNWGICNTNGLQYRQYSVIKNAADGGKTCDYNNGDIQSQACPVACTGNWADWTPCNNGTKTRTYLVSRDALNGGDTCPYINGYVDSSTCPVNCVVSDWSGWGPCDKNCNTGAQTRNRFITIPAKNGGTACPINLTESQPCKIRDCVNCVGSFQGWSACTASCGNYATIYNTYKITQYAEVGGNACPYADGYQQTNTCTKTNCCKTGYNSCGGRPYICNWNCTQWV